MAEWSVVAERVWYGRSPSAALARAALTPLELAFRAAVATRRALYAAGAMRTHALGAPALSVGNLTVGGTGKTPIAAWIAAWLASRGATPAIVLRGYGGDEPAVHALLNPGALVVAAADRVVGAREAVARGATALVLDDAFQHWRARRDIDLVLVSAERWAANARLLPAGPLREPRHALRRASAVWVTRKVASAEDARNVEKSIATHASGVPTARLHLTLDGLRRWTPSATSFAMPDDGVDHRTLGTLAGRRVLTVAAVGEPGSFFTQLERAGALVDAVPFRDHHPFTPAETARLAARAERADDVVCTLKDAVKLGPLWPHLARPLWYVTQRVAVEGGASMVDALLRSLLARSSDARVPGRVS